MLPFLKLIKFDNLLIIALAQWCIKYGLFQPFGIDITLNGFGIALVIIASICIAAAGNIIIMIYDQDEVSQNKLLFGKISEKIANRLFITLNVIGVLIGFYLANMIGKPGFSALFIIVSGIFFVYASYLKEITVVKNIVIAILASLSLIVVGIFDLLPAITEQNKGTQTVTFSILLDYALFTFMIITLREMIKDCIDVDKDHNTQIKTIPVLLGKDRTTKLIGLLAFIPAIFVIYYIYTYLFQNQKAVLFALILIIAPLLYFIIKIWTTKTERQLKMLSLILKLVLVVASLSLLLYQFFIPK